MDTRFRSGSTRSGERRATAGRLRHKCAPLRVRLNRQRRSEEGQDLLEYGLLVALIALFAIGAVGIVGETIHTVFWQSIANNF